MNANFVDEREGVEAPHSQRAVLSSGEHQRVALRVSHERRYGLRVPDELVHLMSRPVPNAHYAPTYDYAIMW